jgi:hypothetical protein
MGRSRFNNRFNFALEFDENRFCQLSLCMSRRVRSHMQNCFSPLIRDLGTGIVLILVLVYVKSLTISLCRSDFKSVDPLTL